MPKKKLGRIPFPPLIKLDTNDPIKPETIIEILSSRLQGASICVRSTEGHSDRGGYFFHICPKNPAIGEYDLFNFESIYVATLPLSKLTALINHCAGLAFDEEAFQFCQTVVNFRLDPESKEDEDIKEDQDA